MTDANGKMLKVGDIVTVRCQIQRIVPDNEPTREFALVTPLRKCQPDSFAVQAPVMGTEINVSTP